MPGNSPKLRLGLVLTALLAPLALSGGEPTEEPAPAAPPSARMVAARALVLHGLYGLRAAPIRGENQPALAVAEAEKRRLRTLEWIRREGLHDAVSRQERRILEAPAGALEAEDVARLYRARESLVALLFALQRLPRLPPPDGSFPASLLATEVLPAVGAPTAEFLAAASLRPADEIAAARALLEVWQLRGEIARREAAEERPQGEALAELARELRKEFLLAGLRPRPMPDGASYFRELVRYSSQRAHAEGFCEAPIDEDFPALGKAYRALEPRTQARLRDAAAERLAALEALAGAPAASPAPTAAQASGEK